jgi:hypothetical protein
MTTARLTGRKALADWPDRLEEVTAEPSDDLLQRLCSLLDAIDRWIVDRWYEAGHAERLEQLTTCRREATEANRRVSEAQRQRSPAQLATLAKARAARDRLPTVPKRFRAVARVDTPDPRPGAA